MNLVQPLLVVTTALGLLAPLVVLNSPSANAADQVTSVTQFSDVYPTDWAYQALANLVEQYGCVAGYPNGTFRGNRAMTRYEAAALLNACLDRITEVTDELRRLLKEFETELAILKGRVDGLEARVGELEATQFSTTTKLSAKTVWVAGATRAKGDNYNTGGDKGAREAYNAEYGAFSFSYDLRLGLKTSFSGKDLLYTRLRAGNGLEDGIGVGPLISEAAIEKIDAQVKDAVEKGARLLAGGHRLMDNGLDRGMFYAPTLLADVRPDMRIYREETFGPVLVVQPADDWDDLRLYFSKTLDPTDWKEHPQSPIVEGSKRFARQGGRIIREDGRLFRIAQDHKLHYGHQVWAMEIDRLTPEEYSETLTSRLPLLTAGGKGWNGIGMHHLDMLALPNGKRIMCVDGLEQLLVVGPIRLSF